ncbi:MAG: flavin reductase family protein [Pseudomonadota bacterium]
MTKTPVSRDAFIAAMRRVASSVSVVTTDGPAGRHGATVSAFCSVSADPPTVLVCLNGPSRIARLVTANGGFCVNVLPEGAEDLARRFAGAEDDDAPNRFSGLDTSGAQPVIEGATGLMCMLDQVIPMETHVICVGRVVEADLGGPRPLTYLDGRYGALAMQEA